MSDTDKEFAYEPDVILFSQSLEDLCQFFRPAYSRCCLTAKTLGYLNIFVMASDNELGSSNFRQKDSVTLHDIVMNPSHITLLVDCTQKIVGVSPEPVIFFVAKHALNQFFMWGKLLITFKEQVTGYDIQEQGKDNRPLLCNLRTKHNDTN